MLTKKLILKVEVLAGTDIRDVATDLCQLAVQLNMVCETSFNNVTLMADPHSNPVRLAESYYKCVLRERNPMRADAEEER